VSDWTRKPKADGEWSRIRSSGADWSPVAKDGGCDPWTGVDNGGSCMDFDGLLCWILDTGRWSDRCFWRDLSLWNDGVEPWAEVA